MSFIKDVVIYEKGTTLIYINQCYSEGRKTKLYAVRRDDEYGLSRYLGTIKFNPRWWQYVFEPDKGTIWSKECLKGICAFLDRVNMKWRKKHR